MKRKVLFLCTGNSCRSQMAEGVVNSYLGDTWHAYSAGVKPSGYVHPLAIQVMDEINIDTSEQVSKSVEIYRNTDFDVVITVCDGAAKNCPVWLGKGHLVHIGVRQVAYELDDPRTACDVDVTVFDAIQLLECFFDVGRQRIVVDGRGCLATERQCERASFRPDGQGHHLLFVLSAASILRRSARPSYAEFPAKP